VRLVPRYPVSRKREALEKRLTTFDGEGLLKAGSWSRHVDLKLTPPIWRSEIARIGRERSVTVGSRYTHAVNGGEQEEFSVCTRCQAPERLSPWRGHQIKCAQIFPRGRHGSLAYACVLPQPVFSFLLRLLFRQDVQYRLGRRHASEDRGGQSGGESGAPLTH